MDIEQMENVRKALIVIPCGGNPDKFDPRYDKEAHWRSKHPARTYEILNLMYNDFEPDTNTYDHIIRDVKGHKWQMIAKAFTRIQGFDFSKYDYIGCIDDDQITDVWNLNMGLELARRFDFRLWQLSMADQSDVFYECLKQKEDTVFSETNFIECGVPVFRNDVFKKILKALTYPEWKYEQAWGLDKAYTDIAQSHAHVIHCASIYHPKREAYYNNDRSGAMNELHDFMSHTYPKMCREIFNRETLMVDEQRVYNTYRMVKHDVK